MLQKINSNDFIEINKKLMVRTLTNPKSDLFIAGLSANKLHDLFDSVDNDSEFINMFWSAFEIAQAEYISKLTRYDFPTYYLKEYLNALSNHFKTSHCCPECGCMNYFQGCACPNCDYVED